MKQRLTHLDEKGEARMVDISEKQVTKRTAVASGKIYMKEEALRAVCEGELPKGDVLSTARIAGIMAAKRTSDLIPMCHPLPMTKCEIRFEIFREKPGIHAFCTVKTEGKTGVEMEALTGVSIALLTVYDMCKALDKSMEIAEIHVEEKIGGKSGHFVRGEGTC